MSVAVARPAAESDGPRIGEISFRSHTISYRSFARASFIEAQVESEHTGYWSGLLLEASGGNRIFVVEWAHQVVGFSMVGPLTDRYEFVEVVHSLGDEGGLAVVYSIHVDPDHVGRGAGRELMRASLEYLSHAGFGVAVLDTHETNRRSRRFYDAGGWEVAATAVSSGGESMAIYRMRLA